MEKSSSVDAVTDESSNPKPDETDQRILENVNSICTRLRLITYDVDRVQRAKELLESLQRRKAFIDLLGLDDDGSLHENADDMLRLSSIHSLREMSRMHASTDSEDMKEHEEMSEDTCLMPFEEERWGNHFTGFEILGAPAGITENENRKCIELCTSACHHELEMYLLSGVRCFMLDLFHGPLIDNQVLIVQLREAEIAVSKTYGFPVVSTICAKLSPRHQYTGYLAKGAGETVLLQKDQKVVLTVDRNYSRSCNDHLIYVNAHFLLCDVKRFDIILIGQDIQLMVRSVRQNHLLCCVRRPGMLSSFMPVLFPARCHRYVLSYEEVEDLTFAREVGIKVVVSYVAGTEIYLNDLQKVMNTLQCDDLRLYARVVLNEMSGCEGELNWIADRYDGFLVEFAEPAIVPDILRLCPNAECFMQQVYAVKKPIIMDAWPINQQHLRVDPAHYYHTFYYPDKYLVRSGQVYQHFYFFFLQSAIYEQIAVTALSKMPYCDASHTGADGMARAIVAASLELQAKAIVVCGVTTRMVQKVSHFRSQVPILFVSHMRSAEDYVCLHHNVTMLPFRTESFGNHSRNVFRKAIFALAYLSTRKIIRNGDYVILVYNYKGNTRTPEKYMIYKFDKQYFVEHLTGTLFSV